LWQEVEAGNFRADLYYRLNVINITIPPLRQWQEDIMLLFDYFLSKIRVGLLMEKEERERIKDYLQNYRWPGNIRELQNVVERMVHMAGESKLGFRHLPPEIRRLPNDPELLESTGDSPSMSIYEARSQRKKMMQEQEQAILIKLLQEYKGNISRVAKEMGVNRSTVYRKMKAYKIDS
jgi:transcriptional regulator with PAS, ATPase and Fis domain